MVEQCMKLKFLELLLHQYYRHGLYGSSSYREQGRTNSDFPKGLTYLLEENNHC